MMNIYGIKRKDLEDYFISNGEKKFKALQVFEWLYDKRVKSFKEMSNIKKELQEKLSEDFNMFMIKIQKKQEDGLTKKYLFKLKTPKKEDILKNIFLYIYTIISFSFYSDQQKILWFLP